MANGIWRVAVRRGVASRRPTRQHHAGSVESETPKLTKGETVVDAIERLRRRVRELKADQPRIRSAPFPSSYCKALMRTQVEQLAQQGAPSVSPLIEHDGQIAWSTQQVQSQVYNTGTPAVAFAEIPDATAMIAWLFKDALIAALDREINTEFDDAAALSHIDREKQESVVLADLLDIERQESTLIWQAQSQNLPCEHRADCCGSSRHRARPTVRHHRPARNMPSTSRRPVGGDDGMRIRSGSCQVGWDGCARADRFAGLPAHLSRTARSGTQTTRRRVGRAARMARGCLVRQSALLLLGAPPTKTRTAPGFDPFASRGGVFHVKRSTSLRLDGDIVTGCEGSANYGYNRNAMRGAQLRPKLPSEL